MATAVSVVERYLLLGLRLGRSGLLEESTSLVPTPQALVSEGIAMHGEQLAVRALGAELTAALRTHGLHYDAERSQAVGSALLSLRGAGDNVALMLHQHGASRDEARAYLQRWRLFTREQAEQSIAFLTDPTWRAYASIYTLGRRLCESWVGDDLARLARLLCEQVAVSELQGEGVSA